MTRIPHATARLAAVLAAALVAGAPGATPAREAPLDGPAYWTQGGPGPDHAARAYPQYAQQQTSTPIRFLAAAALQQRLRSGDRPLIVDVRTYPEYEANRLPGAINIPLDEVEKRLGEIPKQGTVVLY